MITRTFIITIEIFISLFWQRIFAQYDADSSWVATTVTIAAVGDIMMGTTFPEHKNYLPPDNGRHLFVDVKSHLKSADIAFCNLEGPLVDFGKLAKNCKDTTKCYAFRTPARFIRNLVDAGFNLASLANNHSRDFGEVGRDTTMMLLDSVGIAHSGRLGDIASLRIRDLNVGMIAFNTYDGSYNLLEREEAKGTVAELSRIHDILIVSFHGGAEGASALNVPDSCEIYYGEERGHLREFTHAMIDAGADLILGHGPHVPRGMEIYKNRLIAYSLGNFCTYERFNLSGPNGLTYILKAELERDGSIRRSKIISCYQRDPGIPKVDPAQRAAKLIHSLSKQDFGANGVRVGVDGELKILAQMEP
ncbi:CapA family protein [candidate division KSB1 bacterium]|nr:CapA family protein [candidate division KSB1 bacterium]